MNAGAKLAAFAAAIALTVGAAAAVGAAVGPIDVGGSTPTHSPEPDMPGMPHETTTTEGAG